MPSDPLDPPLRFGRFEIVPAERTLKVDGRPAALGARAFDLLLVLARRRESLVTKEELLDAVWPGLVVEEHNIAAQVSSLRKLLGPGAIATVAGRGYRFVAATDRQPADARDDAAAHRPPSHHLPEQRTRFIGREAELAEMTRLLSQARLLTLTGIGGCGKTRLALQCAQQQLDAFPDGVWFVDLAPLREPDRVAAVCAATLQLGEGDSPTPARVAGPLAERHALVVLDNCEHVHEGAAALVDAVLSCPGRTRVLATSRERLGVAGEQLYPVRPLSLPRTGDLDDVRAADAVRVFVDRARLVMPEFDVATSNAGAIVDVCRRLDGIALAIELAAARVTVLSVPEIADRLEDRFRLLTGGASATERHQTLMATMRWSHELLAPEEQRMLRRLSVFAGGCSLDAAAAVGDAADDYEALRLLSALHDKSLVTVERGAGRPRYGMLETVRQYAHRQLEDQGEADDARRRHAEHYLRLAEAAAPHLRGSQQSVWMARLRDEHENLVAAMTWFTQERARGDPEGGLRLAAASGRYWLFNEVELGCRLLLQALSRAAHGVASAARCQTLLSLAAMHMHRSQGDVGVQHARAALVAARHLGAVEWQAMALNGIGACLTTQGDEEAGLRYYEQARDLARANHCAVPLASALNNIATSDFRHGRLQSAQRGLRDALHLERAAGDIRSTSMTLHNLIRALVAGRQHEEAHASAVEAELLLRGVGEDALKLELLEVVAGLASSRGEHRVAARLWGATRQRFTDAGYRRPVEDEAQLERLAAQSRQALGDAAFEQHESAGRALDVDMAMSEMRAWLLA
jgi:predicted ATPase/DNA-binding winged helix-turn-helix (wHTH) protein